MSSLLLSEAIAAFSLGLPWGLKEQATMAFSSWMGIRIITYRNIQVVLLLDWIWLL
jgi:hypothetical protein